MERSVTCQRRLRSGKDQMAEEDSEPVVGMRVRFRDVSKMAITDNNRAYSTCLLTNWGNHVFTVTQRRQPYKGAWLVELALDDKPLTATWDHEKGKKPRWFLLQAGEFYWERYLVPAE